MSAHHSHGVRVYAELRGEARADKMMSLAQKSGAEAAIADLSLEFVFGKVWSRGGLDRKGRSLVMIGALIALRQTDELENHLRVALTNGLTKTEIEEAIVQTARISGGMECRRLFPHWWTSPPTIIPDHHLNCAWHRKPAVRANAFGVRDVLIQISVKSIWIRRQ